jgi:hypothetical protein
MDLGEGCHDGTRSDDHSHRVAELRNALT